MTIISNNHKKSNNDRKSNKHQNQSITNRLPYISSKFNKELSSQSTPKDQLNNLILNMTNFELLSEFNDFLQFFN